MERISNNSCRITYLPPGPLSGYEIHDLAFAIIIDVAGETLYNEINNNGYYRFRIYIEVNDWPIGSTSIYYYDPRLIGRPLEDYMNRSRGDIRVP